MHERCMKPIDDGGTGVLPMCVLERGHAGEHRGFREYEFGGGAASLMRSVASSNLDDRIIAALGEVARRSCDTDLGQVLFATLVMGALKRAGLEIREKGDA